MSSAEALLSFQFILEESCNCFGYDISFALERSKYVWAKCLDVVIYEHIFLCFVRMMGAFLTIQLNTP